MGIAIDMWKAASLGQRQRTDGWIDHLDGDVGLIPNPFVEQGAPIIDDTDPIGAVNWLESTLPDTKPAAISLKLEIGVMRLDEGVLLAHHQPVPHTSSP
jgi:hypothetical protein